MAKWRTGNKVTMNVYEGDRAICQCHTAEDAEKIVAAMNSNKINRMATALKRISEIPNGPDRGSAQSQIDCAVIYAREALMEKPTEGNKEDLYI